MIGVESGFLFRRWRNGGPCPIQSSDFHHTHCPTLSPKKCQQGADNCCSQNVILARDSSPRVGVDDQVLRDGWISPTASRQEV